MIPTAVETGPVRDKLYVQQITNECQHDLAVTVGDLRLYVPVNDPISPWYGLEEWPYCGTKVTSCDIDVEYGLIYQFTDYAWIKFVDKDNDGVFSDDDNAYIDMDSSDDVSTGDIRLTDVAIDGEWFYYNNTKVGDQHEGDKGDEMLPADSALMTSDRDPLSVLYQPVDSKYTSLTTTAVETGHVLMSST